MPYLYSETCHRVSMLVGDARLEMQEKLKVSNFPHKRYRLLFLEMVYLADRALQL